MLNADILNQLNGVPIEERIRIIEMILKSLKQDLRENNTEQPSLRDTVRHYNDSYDSADQSQRPTFGFMKDTGTILGDVVSPVIPESDWEVLQ